MNTVLNIDNKPYVSKAFHVILGYYYSADYVIFADNEQEALDILIDHLEETEDNHPAFFMSSIEESKLTDEERYEYIIGGNAGRMLSFMTHELFMKEIDYNSKILIDIEGAK